MADINGLSALINQGGSAVRNKLISMFRPSGFPETDAAYAQATGENIHGGDIQAQAQPAVYEDPNRPTVNPDEVARYMAMRKAQHDAMQQRGM